MNKEDRKLFFTVVNIVRRLPAFRRIKVRFRNIKDLGRVKYDGEKNEYLILISKKLDFDVAMYTFAHECAHILVDMDNAHGPLFGITEQYCIDLLFTIVGFLFQNSDSKKKVDEEKC
ncbi:MAG: hypothetical protein QXQ37_04915 [Nitrososphaerota archaeon]